MKVYKRILAGTILAGLLLSSISECAGDLSLLSPVSASERFTWGTGSFQDDSTSVSEEAVELTENPEQPEQSAEPESESEKFVWGGDDPASEESNEDIVVEPDQNTSENRDSADGKFAWRSGTDNSDQMKDASVAEDAKASLEGEDILIEDVLSADDEAEMLLGAGTLPDGVTGLRQTVDTNSIMTINLFDYQAYDGGEWDYSINNYSWNSRGIDHSENFSGTTINKDADGKRRQFRFFPSGTQPFAKNNGWYTIDNPYTINNYSGGHDGLQSSAVQGIVAEHTEDNYPVLKTGYTDSTVQSWQVNNDMSLAYLFDPNIPDANVPGRTSYTGLNHLFYIDEQGYYTFDSSKNYAYINAAGGEKDFNLYNLGKDNSNKDLIYHGFYPLTEYHKEWNGKSTSQQHTTKYNHHFSLTMSAEFMIPEGGKINGLDEMFRFSGDDDVWVFVDGRLVLDLGGIHQPIGASINFRTGEITYENGINSTAGGVKKDCTTVQVGQKDSQKQNPRTETQSVLKNIVDNSTPDTVHTIQFFMIERGGCDSNCLLQFNLAMYERLRIGKRVTGNKDDDDKAADFGFIVYLEDENGQFQPLSGNTVNQTGSMLKLRYASDNSNVVFRNDNPNVFNLKDGEDVILTGIPTGRRYYVEEVGVDASRYKVYLGDDEIHVVNNTAQSGPSPVSARPDFIYKNEVRPNKDIRVKKVWYDKDGKVEDGSGITDASVTMRLNADGVEVASVTLDGVEDEIETVPWEHTFENLPVETVDAESGIERAIHYTVKEDSIEGYYTLFDTLEETEDISGKYNGKTYWEAVEGIGDPSEFPRGTYLVIDENVNADRALYAAYDSVSNADNVATLSDTAILHRMNDALEDENGIFHNDYLCIDENLINTYLWNVTGTSGGYSLYNLSKNKWLGYETGYYDYNGQSLVSRKSFALKDIEPSTYILNSDMYMEGSRTGSSGQTIKDYVYNNSGAVEVTQNKATATQFTFYRRIMPLMTKTTTAVAVSNKREIDLPEEDFFIPISKKIDAMRDGDDNPDTNFEDELTDEQKKNLYRLYLDMGPVKNKKTNVILVMDCSESMYPIVSSDNAYAIKVGDNYFDRRYLMTDENGNYVTRYDAMLEAMTGPHSLVDMILPDGNTKNQMYVIGLSSLEKTSVLTGWTTNSTVVENALQSVTPSGYDNYEAALEKARTAISTAPRGAEETYLIFVSDGVPTAYLNGNAESAGDGAGAAVGEMSVQNLDGAHGVIQNTLEAVRAFKNDVGDVKISTVAFSNQAMNDRIEAVDLSLWDDIRHDYKRDKLSNRYDVCLEELVKDGKLYAAGSANALNTAVSTAIPIPRIQGPVIKDQLTDYVTVKGENDEDIKDIKCTMKYPDPADPTKTLTKVLWDKSGPTSYNVQSDNETPIIQNLSVSEEGQVVLTFNPDYVVPDDYVFTVSFNVRATQKAEQDWVANEIASRNKDLPSEERPADGYAGVKGDEGTDFSYTNNENQTISNDTSSKHPGFHSNVVADLTYKVNRDRYREEYKHPVIQPSTTVDITMIKTSSVELPQADGTMAYDILPGVEFTLFEKTIETVTGEDGTETTKEVLTPVKEHIVSDDGKGYEEGADEETIAAAAAKKGKIFLKDLERFKTYYLKETKAADGYFLPGGGWTIVVDAYGKITISGENNYADTYNVTNDSEFPGCYQIQNVKMYELPATGGPGDYLFTIIGISISFAIVLLKLRELKEERAA